MERVKALGSKSRKNRDLNGEGIEYNERKMKRNKTKRNKRKQRKTYLESRVKKRTDQKED
ncbi:hypothetical protein RhiirA1_486446 [Rhizophagus irregularis]|uniref:Uncharacterized protein n=1 Tax=Rhizophagus irregularis TaxID=588596 RepID=A0A2N0QH72_9GLOM|nr:hypothetical protein RhiirA1_486446 [Rhizophagus irregularis]